MAKLTDQELRRYAPQISLPEIGIAGQEKLKDKKILVIGAGGLGTPVMQYLTAAGIGMLGIADDDMIDVHNLQRQVLYGIKDIGKMKSVMARKRLQLQNHMVDIEIFNIRINEKNILETIDPFDMVIDATDNYETRFLLDDACISLNKPWIFGGIYKYEGQVSVFNYQNGPSLRCLMASPPAEIERFNTVNSGLLGVLPGLIGCFQTTEALKVLLDLGEVLSGKLMVVNILKNTNEVFLFEKSTNITYKRLFS